MKPNNTPVMFTFRVTTLNKFYETSRWVSRKDCRLSHHPKKSLMPPRNLTKLPSPQQGTDTDSSMMRQLGPEPEPPGPRPRVETGGADGGI